MSLSEEIERLRSLRDSGTLTDEEFQQAKRALLNDGESLRSGNFVDSNFILGIPEKSWCTLMHLSQLLVFAGGIGLIVPVVMYVVSKEESDAARRHGARMMNWLISSLIYGLVAGILCFAVVGIPLLIVILILDIVFPIKAAIKANSLALWSYPLSIEFIQED